MRRVPSALAGLVLVMAGATVAGAAGPTPSPTAGPGAVVATCPIVPVTASGVLPAPGAAQPPTPTSAAAASRASASPAAPTSPRSVAPTPAASSPGASSASAGACAQDPITAQLEAALAAQAQIDATKLQLGAVVAAAHDEQGHLGQVITADQSAIDTAMSRLADIQSELAQDTADAASAHARADAEHAQAVADRGALSAALRDQYVRGQSAMAYVLGSGSFSDFMSRMADLRSMDGRVGQLAGDLASAEERYTSAQRQAQDAEVRARLAAAALETQRANLQADVAKERALVAQLGTEADAAQREIAAADGQNVDLAQRIADLRIQQLDETIAAAEQAAWDEAKYFIDTNTAALPASATAPVDHYALGVADELHRVPTLVHVDPGAARFIWPAYGVVISQGFGPCDYPFEPPAYGFRHFHTGIDLAGPLGTPIYAPSDGVVVSATPGDTGYGNHVILAIDSHAMALFGHLQAMTVHAGQVIHAGQLIGLMGSTGNSTGPHLHFEVRVDANPVDPTPLLPPLPHGAAGPPPLPPGAAGPVVPVLPSPAPTGIPTPTAVPTPAP